MWDVTPPLAAPSSTLASMNGPVASVTVITGAAIAGTWEASAGGARTKSILPIWLVSSVEVSDEMLLKYSVKSDDPGLNTVSLAAVGPAGPSAPKWMPSVPLAEGGSAGGPASLPVPCGSVADVRPASNTLPEAAAVSTGMSSVSVTVKVP